VAAEKESSAVILSEALLQEIKEKRDFSSLRSPE